MTDLIERVTQKEAAKVAENQNREIGADMIENIHEQAQRQFAYLAKKGAPDSIEGRISWFLLTYVEFRDEITVGEIGALKGKIVDLIKAVSISNDERQAEERRAMVLEMKDCPECGGSGWIPDPAITSGERGCRRCGGSGRVEK